MKTSTTTLAPQAAAGTIACRAPKPGAHYVCAAAKDHDGDHVPWGAASTQEGLEELRKLTWPQKRRLRRGR